MTVVNSWRKIQWDIRSQSFLVFSVARKINSGTNSHKVFIKKNNFETLVPSFLDEELKEVLPSNKENLKHEKMYSPIARNVYENIIKFNLNKNADVRETGCVIQPFFTMVSCKS